jgi:sugar-specific transcriptional regulator TrmB
MYEELLRNIGLTENESKVYLALLKIGLSTSSIIIKEAKISSGKIYEILEKLHKKGLISITKISGVKYFQPTNPQTLINYIDEQKKELEDKEGRLKEILPNLVKLQGLEKNEASVNLLMGERSIKPLVTELFTKADRRICAMGIRGSKKERYNNFWWHITTTIAERKKEGAFYLFSENSSQYYKKHKKLKKIKIKFIDTITPNAVDIIDDNVLIFTYDEDLTCVYIKSKEIAESFRGFFMSLWKIAKS